MARLSLVGTNGSRWDLGGQEVHVDGSSFDGLLGDPEYADQTQERALIDGQEFVGKRALPRSGFFTAKIGYDKPAQFRSIESRWWKAWEPGEYATLEYAVPGRSSRYLDVRFLNDNGWSVDVDPDVFSRAKVPMRVVADDPYWRGDVLKFDFTPNRPPVDFYGRDRGQLGGPRFYLSKSVTKNVQSLFNPGDVPAPVRWVLEGPFSSFELTVAGMTVGGELAVAEGQTLSVDSSARRVLLFDGVSSADVTRRVSWGFADLPPGSAVPVGVLVYGTGRVRAEWTPKYRRAA